MLYFFYRPKSFNNDRPNILNTKCFRPHRLTARTNPSQGLNRSPILREVTNLLREQTALLLKKFVKTEVYFSSKKNN